MFADKKLFTIDYNAACGFLNHLNVEELREILNDDNKFEDMLKDFKQAKDIETEKEMLLVSNRSLAEFNLSRESELNLAKQQLQELSSAVESLYKRIEAKALQLSKKKQARNVETYLALLQTAALEMEEESENIAQGFLSGDSDVDKFLEQFTSRRKLMHLRRVKGDKMTEMVRRRISQRNQQNQGFRNSNLHNNSSFYQPPPPIAAVPYPLGPNNFMPLPAFSPNQFQ